MDSHRPIRTPQTRGLVFPAVLTVTLVIIILTSLLLALGTSSLRLVSFDLQSDQAYYAAEAGLVQAVNDYIQATGNPPSSFQGTLPKSGASFTVTAYENITESPKAGPSGISIPPGTVYFLAEGKTKSGATRKTGALVRIGAGAFRAGILAERVQGEATNFIAYDSRSDVVPGASQVPGQGILTSNRTGTHLTPQFTLIDTNVAGAVYTAAGTSPEVQLEQIGSTTVEYASSLAEPITVEAIEIPKVERGQAGSSEGGVSEDELPIGHTEVLRSSAPNLRAIWKGDSVGWEFRHGSYTPITIPASGGSASFTSGQTVNVRADGSVEWYHNSSTPYELSVPGTPPPTAENPDELTSGLYGEVSITDGHTTDLQDGGVFVVENLRIIDSGQLRLDADNPVSIYVTGSLTIEGENAILNTTQRPPNLKIYYTGTQDVNLAGGAQAYFTLIAPDANINLTGPTIETPEPEPPEEDLGLEPGEDDDPGGDLEPEPEPEPAPAPPPGPTTPKTSFYGALVGKNVTVYNADFFYDVATEGVGSGSDSTPFKLISRHRL